MANHCKEDNIWKIKFEGAKPLNENSDLDEMQRQITFELAERGYLMPNGAIIF